MRSHKLRLGALEVNDYLTDDGRLEINVDNQLGEWIDKEDAMDLINHLITVFKFSDNEVANGYVEEE